MTDAQPGQPGPRGFGWKNILAHRAELFGISTLWIIALHLQQFIPGFPKGAVWAAAETAMEMGSAGVDVFIILSAVGLWHSMERNTPRQFYVNRLKRALIPYLIFGGGYLTLRFIVERSSFVGLLLDVTMLRWWFETTMLWYPFFMLVTYLIFPLLYHGKKRLDSWLIWGLAAVSVAVVLGAELLQGELEHRHELFLSRMPVFLVCTAMAERWLKDGRFRLRDLLCTAGILAVLAALWFWGSPHWHVTLERAFKSILMMYLLMGCTYLADHVRNARPLQKIQEGLRWVGARSFEIYLAHQVMLTICDGLDVWHWMPAPCWYLAVIAFGLIAGALAHWLNGWLVDRLFQKRS